MDLSQTQLLSFKHYFIVHVFPLSGKQFQFVDSEQFSSFNVLLIPGVEVDEELHVFTDALPNLSLVENDISFQQRTGLYFGVFERDFFFLHCEVQYI